MIKFDGKIQGVNLYQSSMSTVRLVGHLADTGCTITIETSRETAKMIHSQYGIDDKCVPISLGNGEDL